MIQIWPRVSSTGSSGADATLKSASPATEPAISTKGRKLYAAPRHPSCQYRRIGGVSFSGICKGHCGACRRRTSYVGGGVPSAPKEAANEGSAVTDLCLAASLPAVYVTRRRESRESKARAERIGGMAISFKRGIAE